MGKSKYLFFVLILIGLLVWISVYFYPGQILKIIACDVGQGDAVLVVHGKTQILFDGGPNNKVVDCLSRHLPFWDRQLEMVVLTHPQKDHYFGLIEVFKRYDVTLFLANSIDSGSQDYQVLKKVVGGSGIRVVNPTSGKSIRLGMIHLDILHPSNDFIVNNSVKIIGNRSGNQTSKISDYDTPDVLGTYTTTKDPNDFSVVILLHYGDYDALFTGDIGRKVSDDIAKKIADEPDPVEFIKVPHHGSKNGISKSLIESSNFQTAVISAGKNNRYNHPHTEVVELLSSQKIKFFNTADRGDVVIQVRR